MEMITVQVEALYQIGDSVYLRTDPEQLEHIVCGYYVREMEVQYIVSFMGQEVVCYGFELADERNNLKHLFQ